MLTGCEARFVSLPVRGNRILPEWLRDFNPAPARAPTAPAAAGARAEQPAAAADERAADGAASAEQRPEEAGPAAGPAAAEALAAALRGAGCRPATARQLLFGDWVVIYRYRESGQAAVLPWLPALRASNKPGRAVGSAVATTRVLASRGYPVVLAGEREAETVTECVDLFT